MYFEHNNFHDQILFFLRLLKTIKFTFADDLDLRNSIK